MFPGTLTNGILKLIGPNANWASVSEPHTSVFNGEFFCAYGVRTYVRTHIPHIVSRFNITFQIVQLA